MKPPEIRDPFSVHMTAQPLEDLEDKEIFSRKWLIRLALVALGFIGGRLSASQKPDGLLQEKARVAQQEQKLCENELRSLQPVIERIRQRNSSHAIPDCHAAFIDLLLSKHGLGALEHAFRYSSCAPDQLAQMDLDVMAGSLEYGRLCE